MEIRAINPQTWLDAFHINQAIEVKSGQRVLYVSGQTSNDAKGAPLHAGDIVAQTRQAWANLVEVVEAGGMKPANIRPPELLCDRRRSLHGRGRGVGAALGAGRLQAREHAPRRHPPLPTGDHDRDRGDRRRLTPPSLRDRDLECTGRRAESEALRDDALCLVCQLANDLTGRLDLPNQANALAR